MSAVSIRNRDFVRGARHAADIAAGYDGSSVHAHRLGDCILGKMNLRAAKPRRNTRKLPHPYDAWIRGFASGVAQMYLRLIAGGDAAGVRAVCAAAGLYLDDFRRVGVHVTDLRALRQARVPDRRPASGGVR
ncbi:MAG: hypothetical protein V4515_12840 [Chloroflexota bacterium]